MMIKAIIVDDELNCRESLYNILEKYFKNIVVIDKIGSPGEAYDSIMKHKPDLVFLDIEMPKENAFDLLEKFNDDIQFDIIFTTAYNHYAVKAIKFSALDYLLKPIDIDDLREAIARLEKKKNNRQLMNNQMNILFSNLKQENKRKKIVVPDGEGLLFIYLDEIIRCESDGNYTFFILNNKKKIIVSKTLGDYEELFTEESFFRIHRSHLINLQHIKKYIRGEGGYVIMSDDSQVEVSRRKKIEFLELLERI
jgi:two-component system, LytTR family, response regulator